jgi:uncharacterized protein (DUF2249 family)
VVIRRTDRVSTVLRADESLIDVFVALSPAFERLRNSAMRKVMSRLVTVEQAAKMAGVDADELVSRLNAAGSERAEAEPAMTSAAPRLERQPAPPELRAVPEAAIVELDVREDLRNGKEPFSRIMAARREVPPGGALRIRAIFEPVPLYTVMEKQGFAHHTEQLGPEDWSVWFYSQAVPPEAEEPRESPATAVLQPGSDDTGAADSEGIVVLDVRGLEPPEPMVRTLAALEDLPHGATLVQLNVRVPQFLLPQLEERGFTYDIREQSPDLVRLFITRNQPKA